MGFFRLILVILFFYIIFRAILKIGKIIVKNSNSDSKYSESTKKGKVRIIKGKEKKKIIPDGHGEYVDYEEL